MEMVTEEEMVEAGIPVKVKKSPARFMVVPRKRRDGEKEYYFPEIFVEITHSKNDIPCMPATAKHKRLWPREWAEFEKSDEYQEFLQSGEEEVVARTYTPLTELKGIGESTADLYKREGINCIEDLAKREPKEVEHIWQGKATLAKAKDFVSQQ